MSRYVAVFKFGIVEVGCAPVGALDPQHASAASEELKAALLKQGVLRTLAEVAFGCAERLVRAPRGEAAR